MAKISKEQLEALFNNAKDELIFNTIPKSKADYEISTFSLIQILEATAGPNTYQFILARTQHDVDLGSTFEALQFLLEKAKEKFNSSSLETKAKTLEKLFLFTLRHFHLFIIRSEPLNQTFAKLLQLFPEQQKQLFSEKTPNTAWEVIFYLTNNYYQNNKEKMYKTIVSNLLRFDEIYISGKNQNEIFDTMLTLFPDKKSELIEARKCFLYDEFEDFVKYAIKSVNNRPLNQYPTATLNKDDSVSFYTLHFNETKENDPCESCGKQCEGICRENCRKFDSAFAKDNFAYRLDNKRKELNYSLIENAKEIIDVSFDEKTNITEYKVNLTPEQLDSIFKSYSAYGYREEGNILKFRKTYSAKEGYIRLSPVFPLEEKQFVFRATGCQTTEMPTVQLLHLLPNFDGVEKYFHWVPPQVFEELNLCWTDVEMLLNQIFQEQKMLAEENFLYFQDSHGMTILDKPTSEFSPLKIVPMDDKTREFYVLYGNSTNEELQHCQSLEISTLDFLNAIQDMQQKNLVDEENKPESSHRTTKIAELKHALNVLKEMKTTEEKKSQKEAISAKENTQSLSSHTNTFFKHPDATTPPQQISSSPKGP